MHSDQLEPLLRYSWKEGTRRSESSRSAASAGRRHYALLALLCFVACPLFIFFYLQLRHFRLGFQPELYPSASAETPWSRQAVQAPYADLRWGKNGTVGLLELAAATAVVAVTPQPNDQITVQITQETQCISMLSKDEVLRLGNMTANGTIMRSDFLIVHYVRLYPEGSPGQPLNFIDCLGLYSVFLLLKPDRILLHTNAKDVWPFDNCEKLLNKTPNWSIVQTILAPLQHTINGTLITYIEHEADIRKLRALEEYGGIVLDFDVVIINGSAVRALWAASPCFICWEPDRNSTNAGFLGCRQPQAMYPHLILQQYQVAYRPDCWSCNSGFVPWNIWSANQGLAVLADNVCNEPDFYQRNGLNQQRGKYSWKDKPAYHSFLHDDTFDRSKAHQLDSTLGDIFRWLLMDAPPHLLGQEIPPLPQ